MKRYVAFAFILLAGCSPKAGPTLTLQPNRLLYASSDINRVSLVDSIRRIRSGGLLLGRNVKFTLRDGTQKKILQHEIWGYSDGKGNVWRHFRKSLYQVVRVSDVVEYVSTRSRFVGQGVTVHEPVWLYSQTLDSRIVGSRKRALKINGEPLSD
ncbi:hypothetical protein [Spirosoma sordidisoli]|uniref:Uncharacterized protein n=1 Tax=Spirosoma sordidisoli TaxID=2502893 RepID=A0A4Q2ULF4_9BACT|nr:hypothetical protein [Spirosoma sordidisoli]RYC70373.1 hypothetical protein EQG79_10970 [Spirosoma sordidisoli]